jgi:hypothetical protein
MKLVMTLVVRDEADILRENIEFHLAHGVDEFIVMDNLSEDGTPEIVREYERAGVARLLSQREDDFAQGRWVTGMAVRAATELGADWVINSDADEFWWTSTGSLKEALSEIGPSILAVSAERTNFVPRPESLEPFWRRMDVRHAGSVNLLGQPLPPKVAHRARGDVTIAYGNHSASVAGAVVPAVSAPVTILHFPLRSRRQFRNKIVKGAAALARNTEVDRGVGNTWREMYERHLNGELDLVYEAECRSQAELARGLDSGELLRDTRLIAALERVRVGQQFEATA